VEVQDKKKKVDLPTFDSWCKKREKVGAPTLIGVSRKGFTKEVVKAAAKMRDAVRLMTLCEAGQKPLFLATTVVVSHLQVLCYRDAKVVYIEKVPPISFLLDDKVFEFPDFAGKKVSLHTLAEASLRKGWAMDVVRYPVDSELYDLKYRVEFGAAGRPLLLKHEDQTYSVREAYFVDRMEEVHQGLTSTPLAYEQKTVDGLLALVLLSKGSYHGKEFYTQQSFLKLPNGRFQPGPPAMSKIEGMHTVSHFVEMLVPVEQEQTGG
jgi:hypothetical protein